MDRMHHASQSRANPATDHRGLRKLNDCSLFGLLPVCIQSVAENKYAAVCRKTNKIISGEATGGLGGLNPHSPQGPLTRFVQNQ